MANLSFRPAPVAVSKSTYCSRDCQRAHWKTNHKQHCVTKSDRVTQVQNSSHGFNNTSPEMANATETCSICLDSLGDAPAATLRCKHDFHVECILMLRKFGVDQKCPLCRNPLPPGPEQLCDDAFRRYMVIHRLVERGDASWDALPASAQRALDVVVANVRAAADEGQVQAQCNLGHLYEMGHGLVQCDAEAARWTKKAAESGHAVAQCGLAFYFMEGRGVQQSHEEAAQWYRHAAEQGNAEAQRNLGNLFENGCGVAQSDTQAAYWLRKSADQGFDLAQYELGCLYDEGRGVRQSDKEAVQWFRKAAIQGCALAQVRLGVSYECGHGIVLSSVNAAHWYCKAAEQGELHAQSNLAALYAEGRGLTQSYEAAAHWLKKAAVQGYAQALRRSIT